MITFTEPKGRERVIAIADMFDPALKDDVMSIAEEIKIEGKAEGIIEGKAEGKTDGINISKLIVKALGAGLDNEEIAQRYQVPLQDVLDLKDAMNL